VEPLSLGGLLDESAQGAVAEEAVLECLPAGPVDSLPWMAASQADQPLQQTVGAHATLLDDRLGPSQRLRSDVLSLAEQNGFVHRLTGWSMQRSVFGFGGVAAWLHAQMDCHRPALTIGADAVDAHQVTIPLNAHLIADQCVRHRVESAVHFDVSVGMDCAGADLEQAKRLSR
jgi:hypothetical protein